MCWGRVGRRGCDGEGELQLHIMVFKREGVRSERDAFRSGGSVGRWLVRN